MVSGVLRGQHFGVIKYMVLWYRIVFCVTMCTCRLQPIQNNMLLALNHEYIELSDEAIIYLHPADEVAVIPPLSGG